MSMVKNIVKQGVEIVAEFTDNTSIKLLSHKISTLESENKQLKEENLALRQSIVNAMHKIQDMTSSHQRDLDRLEKFLHEVP